MFYLCILRGFQFITSLHQFHFCQPICSQREHLALTLFLPHNTLSAGDFIFLCLVSSHSVFLLLAKPLFPAPDLPSRLLLQLILKLNSLSSPQMCFSSEVSLSRWPPGAPHRTATHPSPAFSDSSPLEIHQHSPPPSSAPSTLSRCPWIFGVLL